MNTLKIWLTGGQYIVYRTFEDDAAVAFEAFLEEIDRMGADLEGLNILKVYLEGPNGEDIGRLMF